MRFPGEILVQHKWIVLFAVLVVVAAAFAGANRETYDYYMEQGPDISWENVPESALTLFFWNMRNTLMSLLGFVLAIWSGVGLGISLGIGIWIISQNPLGIVMFSYGILEIYSAVLAIVGGLLVLAKIGEAIWGFFGKLMTPHYEDWNKVAEEYLSLFLFSIVGLFVSAWMEAFYGYAVVSGGFLWMPIVVVNTLISLLIVSCLSSSTVRALVTRKAQLTIVSSQKEDEKILGSEKLPNGVWCVCPKCGAYISADIEYCGCGAKLPKRKK